MLVDQDYYNNTYYGETISESTDFDKLNLRAEDDVNNASFSSVDDIEDWEEDYVKKAICSQIEFYYLNGDTYNDLASDSESIGKYSRSGSNSGNGSNTILCRRCKQYLQQSNMLFRGVRCE